MQSSRWQNPHFHVIGTSCTICHYSKQVHTGHTTLNTQPTKHIKMLTIYNKSTPHDKPTSENNISVGTVTLQHYTEKYRKKLNKKYYNE